MKTETTITNVVADCAADCASDAVEQGLTPEHLDAEWDLAEGDIDALVAAVGRELTVEELSEARSAFEEAARELFVERVQATIDEDIDEDVEEAPVSPEALLLANLLLKKLAKLRRPHVHTYWTDELAWRARDFFEDEPEDLGRDKGGDQKWRHILREDCTITKVASRSVEHATEIVYLLAGPVGDDGERVERFLSVFHCGHVETKSEDLDHDEVPAWAWLQFEQRISK